MANPSLAPLGRLGISILWNSTKRHTRTIQSFYQERTLGEYIQGTLGADNILPSRSDFFYYRNVAREDALDFYLGVYNTIRSVVGIRQVGKFARTTIEGSGIYSKDIYDRGKRRYYRGVRYGYTQYRESIQY